MNCPTCHSPNEPDARFCKNCGGALAASDTIAVQPPGRSRRLPFIIGGGGDGRPDHCSFLANEPSGRWRYRH
ncbi:MAG: zinc ribbon domain-containing protein [Anaerolineales bacterium]|nr:zinc ribbon domain-containing protein [Anaerolineales bacterium]